MTAAAAASAVSAGALAVAAMPSAALQACSLDDSSLIKLEEQIFEQWWAAKAFDPELIRLSEIWHAESQRLAAEVNAGRSTMTPQERWDIVWAMPEAKEHERLVNLQDEPYAKMDALVKEMFETPAHTPEGRRAKVMVLLNCIMGDDWCHTDEETEYPRLMARNLLIEFIGGEPGKQLGEQFE